MNISPRWYATAFVQVPDIPRKLLNRLPRFCAFWFPCTHATYVTKQYTQNKLCNVESCLASNMILTHKKSKISGAKTAFMRHLASLWTNSNMWKWNRKWEQIPTYCWACHEHLGLCWGIWKYSSEMIYWSEKVSEFQFPLGIFLNLSLTL